MSDSLERAISALRFDREPWPERLRALSDLEPRARPAVEAAWNELPAERRQEILRMCAELSRAHIELNFHWLARLSLADAEGSVRQIAIANLWECEDPDLSPVLLRMLESDPDVRVRIEAAEALERFVDRAELTDADPEWWDALSAGLIGASLSAERALTLKAIEALGHSSHPDVPDLIAQAYAAADEPSVRSALLAMGRSGDARWSRAVSTELRNPAPRLRAEAARAAGELELRQAVPELLELLRDVHPDVQRAAVGALAQIGGRRAAKALERVARRGDDEALAEAAEEALELLAFVEETRQFETGLGLRDEVE